MRKVRKQDAETTFTQRVLMSLVVEMQHHGEAHDRLQAQIFALAKENGVPIPKWG